MKLQYVGLKGVVDMKYWVQKRRKRVVGEKTTKFEDEGSAARSVMVRPHCDCNNSSDNLPQNMGSGINMIWNRLPPWRTELNISVFGMINIF